jgi:hypothetical protein
MMADNSAIGSGSTNSIERVEKPVFKIGNDEKSNFIRDRRFVYVRGELCNLRSMQHSELRQYRDGVTARRKCLD